jgi:hypothetical protein
MYTDCQEITSEVQTKKKVTFESVVKLICIWFLRCTGAIFVILSDKLIYGTHARYLLVDGGFSFELHHVEKKTTTHPEQHVYVRPNNNEIPEYLTWQGSATIMVLNQERTKVLVGKHKSRGGKWSLLTGMANHGETPHRLAIREAGEEAGINLIEECPELVGIPSCSSWAESVAIAIC